LLSQSIARSRSLTVQLSPPVLYETGLAAALEWLGRHVQETLGLVVEVEAAAGAEPESEDLRILLFEAVRELLFNVVKHAGTSRAHVSTSTAADGCVHLVVSDQGAGFDPARPTAGDQAGGFGLFSIRERLEVLGGRMEVRAAPGLGTRVTIVAPGRRARPVPSETPKRAVAAVAGG
jgi:signal transduction histidine kinase